MNTTVADTKELHALVKTVLSVARLGEADRRGWWASHGFGAAGRVVLTQRMPRTWRMAAIELDVLSAANRHNEVIDRAGAVHLFSDRWPVRRWASAWVSEQKTSNEPDPLFGWLETATADEIAETLTIDVPPRVEAIGQALRIGSDDLPEQATPAGLLTTVQKLGAAYLIIESTMQVPYLEVGAWRR
jgi:hypothetical protein